MSKTIMAVDDSSSIRQLVGFTLKEAGFDVIEASDGVEAMDKLEANTVHMMLVDLNMPNMDGISLIKAVRADAQHKFIPMVMLTTESQEGKKNEGRTAGATGWIVKPFKSDQLVALVKKVLG